MPRRKMKLGCHFCSGIAATRVAEPCVVRSSKKLSLPDSESEMTRTLFDSDKSVVKGDGPAYALTSPYLPSDLSVTVKVLFCPVEEESVAFHQLVDSDHLKPQHLDVKTPTHMRLTPTKGKGVSNYYASILHGSCLDGPLLLPTHDQVFHQLAIINQVSAFTELPGKHTEELKMVGSFRNSVTILGFASTTASAFTSQAVSVVPMHLTQNQEVSGSAIRRTVDNRDQSLNFRPQAPAHFSRRMSQDSCFVQYSNESLLFDPNVGHTSTTYDLRWTQLEQDGTANCNPPIVTHSPDASGPVRTSVDERTTTTSTTLMALLHGFPIKDRKRCQSMPSITSRDESCTMCSFDEFTGLEEPSNLAFHWAPFSSALCSSYGQSNFHLTGVEQQSNAQRTPICPYSYSTTVAPSRSGQYCPKCFTSRLAVRHQSTQTVFANLATDTKSVTRPEYPKLGGPNGMILAGCALRSSPMVSEPPSVHIRTIRSSIPGYIGDIGLSGKLPTSLSLYDCQPATIPKLTVSFEPFEKFTPSEACPFRPARRSRKMGDLANLDLNRLEHSLTEHTVTSSGESANKAVTFEHFRCVYVQISIRRNLEGVSEPANLNLSDARAVRTLLNQKLQNAVATLFPPNAVTSKTSVLSDSQSSLTGNENGSSVGSRTNHLATKRHSSFNLYVKRFGSLYKYHPKHALIKRAPYAIFAPGPKHCQPPKQWRDHCSGPGAVFCRSVSAWKLDHVDTCVGGLINYGHHLQIVSSSNDGRLGVVYEQADALLRELVRKGTRYVTESVPGKNVAGPEDSVHLFIHSPVLARLVSTSAEDMSSAVGLENLGIRVSMHQQNKQQDVIVIWARTNGGAINSEDITRYLTCIQRLRQLSQELIHSTRSLAKNVMPVETRAYLLKKIRQSQGNSPNWATAFVQYLEGQTDGVATAYHGTLSHCIRTSAYCPSEPYPRASDPHAYQLFEQMFAPILRAFCRINDAYFHPSTCYTLPSNQNLRVPSPCVLSYRIRFCRNLSGFGFAPVMTRQDFDNVERLCKEALLSWRDEGSGTWYRLDGLNERNPKLFQSLHRKQLLVPKQTVARQVYGTSRFWPHGRSIYVAKPCPRNCDLVVQINCDDHLRVICIDWTGKQPCFAYNRAVRLMSWLDSKLTFSRSPHWGFLNIVPSNVGTGMKLSCWLKVANTSRTVSAVESMCSRHRLQICATRLHNSTALYHHFNVAPRSSIGRTEAEIVVGFLHALNELTEICRKTT